jgi:hypothetical protein
MSAEDEIIRNKVGSAEAGRDAGLSEACNAALLSWRNLPRTVVTCLTISHKPPTQVVSIGDYDFGVIAQGPGDQPGNIRSGLS